jgi:H+/Cl- antiporter ClcA
MNDKLGDFTSTPRMIAISGMAVFIGLVSAFVALALLKLIGLFTNLFFFGRWSATLVSPAGNHLGWLEILVPVAGALIIGVMARYDSERIRGHGIPEAIEAIPHRRQPIEPKVALLKPLSSALSIGTGGPFGAEGPIIITGGAFGSMIAQLFKLTSNERKTLLVAGAAGGMAATFAAPVASVLLAVELLLFEWKPRSLVPVPAHPVFIGPSGLLACVLVGLAAGALSAYAAEDAFRLLQRCCKEMCHLK